jgi:hypothetical protein
MELLQKACTLSEHGRPAALTASLPPEISETLGITLPKSLKAGMHHSCWTHPFPGAEVICNIRSSDEGVEDAQLTRTFKSVYYLDDDPSYDIDLRYSKARSGDASQAERWLPTEVVCGPDAAKKQFSPAVDEIYSLMFVVSTLINKDWGAGDQNL